MPPASLKILPGWLHMRWRRAVLELASMPLGRKLVRGAVASLALTGIGIVLGIANSVLLGRLLGPSGFGMYSFLMLAIMVVTTPVCAGLQMLLTREAGKALAGGSRQDMRALLGWSFRLAAGIAAGLTLAAAALLLGFANWLGVAWTAASLAALPLIGLSMLSPVNSTALRGLGGLVRSQFCDLALRPGLTLAALLAAFALARLHGLGVPAALLAQTVALAATTVLSGWWLLLGWRGMPATQARTESRLDTRSLWPSLMAFATFAAASALFTAVDSLLLVTISGRATLGVYRIALVAAQLMSSFIAAVNTIALPSVAKLHAEGDKPRLQRLLTATSRASFGLAAPLVAVLVLFGAPLIRLGFGEAYVAGAPALAIVAVGQLIGAAAGPAANMLSMSGHEQKALIYVLAGALANAVLCLLLIPRFGLNGAALASAAGGLVMNGLLAANERRLTGVTSSVLGAR